MLRATRRPPVTAWHVRVTKQIGSSFDPASYRWLAALSDMEPAFARAFIGSVQASVSATHLGALAEGYAFGNVAAVESRVAWDTMSRTLQNNLAQIYPQAMERGAMIALAEFGSPTSIWRVVDPHVQQFISMRTGELVREVMDSTKMGIRSVISRSYADGLGPSAAARQIRSMIGLTDRQSNAVLNFEAGLRQAIDEGKSAASIRSRWELARGLVRSERALTTANVPKLVERYRERYVRYRANVIARTETHRAMMEGKWMGWQEANKEGLVPPTAVLEWIVTPDERLCDICMPSHGEQVRMGEPFATGVDRPPAHIMCRCDVRMVMDPANVRSNVYRERTDTRIAELRAERAARRAALQVVQSPLEVTQ